MHQFCIKCGVKNLYETNVPKFCSGCGKPFNRSDSSISQDSDEDDFQDPTPKIDKRSLAQDWGVQDYGRNSATIGTFGDLALNNPTPPQPRMARPESMAGLNGQDLVKTLVTQCSKVTKSREV